MPPRPARRRPLVALLAALATLAAAAPATAAEVPAAWARAWPGTDFTTLTVDPGEIVSGGVGRDGIPAIDAPEMRPVAEETALGEREPVMVLALNGVPARAYPLRYLIWHEIVNDTVAGLPVAVTFCPLCNSGLVFDRRMDGAVLEFGVTGMLRHSDLVMYDRQTESWWQQFSGRAIAGVHAGRRLTALPALLEGWERFAEEHPDGLVMAEPTGHRRRYGTNPYEGYDTGPPFLYRGEPPPQGIDPVARVLRVGARAWPLERLRQSGRIEEAGLLIDWRAGQASALDTRAIAEGREVGSIRVTDAATGAPVVHEVVFAFAFHAFEPEGDWMLGD